MSVERVVGVDFGTSSSVIQIDGDPMGETVGADYIRGSITAISFLKKSRGKYLSGRFSPRI